MTARTPDTSRISDAGVDVSQIARTAVLIKVDDIAPGQLRGHPVLPLCRALGALGVGAIDLQGACEYYDELAEVMKEANFTQTPGAWIDEAAPSDAPAADFVIDLTSDPESKSQCAALCSERSSHFVSAALGRTWVGVASVKGTDITSGNLHACLEPDEFPLLCVSRVAAGTVLQEVLLVAGRVDLAAPAESEIFYNIASRTRTGRDNERPWPPVIRITDAVVHVIGAGAVGTQFLECFAPMLGRGCELHIFDPDEVGPENLALQTAYSHEDLGASKAAAVSEKLARLCDSTLSIRADPLRYEERPPSLPTPSIRVVCADNFGARHHVNSCSLADGVPIAEAGSSPRAAQQRSYLPGHTACLEHRIRGLAERAAAERVPASCAANRQLTLPGTNMIIAGILAAEAIRLLRPEVFGWPSRGTISYHAHLAERFGVTDTMAPCSHPEARGLRHHAVVQDPLRGP